MGIVPRLSAVFILCVASLSAQTPERVIALQGETHHVQGVALTAGRFLVTSVERQSSKGWLMEFDGDGRRLRAVQIQDGTMFHPGGFDIDETSIWIPVAEYRAKTVAASSAVSGVISTDQFVRRPGPYRRARPRLGSYVPGQLGRPPDL